MPEKKKSSRAIAGWDGLKKSLRTKKALSEHMAEISRAGHKKRSEIIRKQMADFGEF